MSVLDSLQTRAAASPVRIVLSEGHDPRIVAAAVSAVAAGISTIILIGPTDEITKQLSDIGSAPSDAIKIEDPATSALTAEIAQSYYDLRQHKGLSMEVAERQALDPLVFAAMLVRNGHADGTVGGGSCNNIRHSTRSASGYRQSKNCAIGVVLFPYGPARRSPIGARSHDLFRLRFGH